MTTMLEQAIVDAKVLKETAMKNAESAILEKYSQEIKNVVDSLLEADVGTEEIALGADLAGGEEEMVGAPPGADEFVQDIPRADTDGEKLCPCPDEEKVIEIDFERLADEMEAEEGKMGAQEMEAREEALPMPAEEEPFEEPLQERDDTTIKVDEDQLVDILEELIVDMMPTKSGWLNRAGAEVGFEEDLALAAAAADPENLQPEIEKELELSKKKNKELQKENQKIKQLVHNLKGRLDEINLSNARLLYTNRILNSTSLNERQKNKIVETISNATSVEEAKVIFETLQSTVRSSNKKNSPESLSEAVTRNRSTASLLMSRKTDQKTSKANDVVTERWKKLAGIE